MPMLSKRSTQLQISGTEGWNIRFRAGGRLFGAESPSRAARGVGLPPHEACARMRRKPILRNRERIRILTIMIIIDPFQKYGALCSFYSPSDGFQYPSAEGFFWDCNNVC